MFWHKRSTHRTELITPESEWRFRPKDDITTIELALIVASYRLEGLGRTMWEGPIVFAAGGPSVVFAEVGRPEIARHFELA